MTIRYLDSGIDGPTACLGRWLDRTLDGQIRAFRGQFGFFDITALQKYLPRFERMLQRGGLFRLVIGANPGDPPSTDDLMGLLPLLQCGGTATLTVVGYSNALFHSKTLHIVRENGIPVGVVGSANLTAKGLGQNVEAGLVIERGTRELMDSMADAIDYWCACNQPGVHQVASPNDVNRLIDLGLVVRPQARRHIRSAMRARGEGGTRGTRRAGWRPLRRRAQDELPEVEGSGETQASNAETAQRLGSRIAARWCKRLRGSDAQQVRDGTNPTGKLRLSQAGFSIDHTVYFRTDFFGGENWRRVRKRGARYEQADIAFDVSRPRLPAQRLRLRVDHATHRVAGQGNVTTVLAWGPELGQWLRAHDQTRKWVVLEKTAGGSYQMSFVPSKPAWAP